MIILLLSTALYVGCSSAAQSGSDPSSPASPSSGLGENTVLLPFHEQANTVLPDLVIDASGVQHAAYADLDGRVIYAMCQTKCADSANWSSTVISSIDLKFGGFVIAKLQVDGSMKPHIAFYTSSGNYYTSYASCQTSCLSAHNWQVTFIHQHSVEILEFQVKHNEWFALTNSGQPRFAFLESKGFIDRDGVLNYFSCNDNCHEQTSWTKQLLASPGLVSDTAANLKFDAENNPHIVVRVRKVLAEQGDIVYYRCLDNCSSDAAVWSSGLSLITIADTFENLNEISLAVSATNSLAVTVFSDDTQSALYLFLCAQACTDSASWSRLNLTELAVLPNDITAVGRGIDSAFIKGVLSLSFTSKKLSVNLPNFVQTLSCSNDCLQAANWQLKTLSDTSGIKVEGSATCVNFGTAASGPTSLSAASVGFVVSPHWACGGTEVVEIIEPETGNKYIEYIGDIRFAELAAVTLQP